MTAPARCKICATNQASHRFHAMFYLTGVIRHRSVICKFSGSQIVDWISFKPIFWSRKFRIAVRLKGFDKGFLCKGLHLTVQTGRVLICELQKCDNDTRLATLPNRTLIGFHKGWCILTGQWSWKLKFAKEYVTTHLTNGLTALIFASLPIRRQCFNSAKSARCPASFTLKFRILFRLITRGHTYRKTKLAVDRQMPSKTCEPAQYSFKCASDSLNLLGESSHNYCGRHTHVPGPAIWADWAPTTNACIFEHEVLYPKRRHPTWHSAWPPDTWKASISCCGQFSS